MRHPKFYGGTEDKRNKTTLVSCPAVFHFPHCNQLISLPSLCLPGVWFRHPFLCTLTAVSNSRSFRTPYSVFTEVHAPLLYRPTVHCARQEREALAASILSPWRMLVPLKLGSHRYHCNDKCNACLLPKYTFKSL